MRAKTRYAPAERVALLKRAEALISRGASIGTASVATGVKYGTLYNWRRRYGGLTENGAATLRLLERENARLRRALLDLEPAEPARGRIKLRK